MAWKGQHPPADDVICNFIVYDETEDGMYSDRRVEVDKLPDGRYRFTTGDLFGFEELFAIEGAEDTLNVMQGMAACQTFDALRAYVQATREALEAADMKDLKDMGY